MYVLCEKQETGNLCFRHISEGKNFQILRLDVALYYSGYFSNVISTFDENDSEAIKLGKSSWVLFLEVDSLILFIEKYKSSSWKRIHESSSWKQSS